MERKNRTYNSFAAAKIFTAALVLIVLFSKSTWGLTPQPGTAIVNTARLTYNDANGNPLDPVSASVQTILTGAPVLNIDIRESTDPVASGAVLSYTVSFENTGNAGATNIVSTIVFPDTLTYQSMDGDCVFAPGPPGSGSLSCNTGHLDSGESGSFIINLLVDTALPDGTDITTTGTISCDEGASDTFVVSTSTGESPNLSLTKSVSPSAVIPGGTVTYKLDYKNTGNMAASFVNIKDLLPNETALISGSVTDGGNLNHRTVGWDLGSLAPGDSGSVYFQVETSSLSKVGTSIVNRATIASMEQGTILSNDAIVYISALSLSFTVSDDVDPVIAGNNITYSISVLNDGVSIENILITSAIPENTSFVSATGNGVYSDGVISWIVSNLDFNESVDLELVVNVDTGVTHGTVLNNDFTVSSNDTETMEHTELTTVSGRTQGTIDFQDEAGNTVYRYGIGDKVCVQVEDADRNMNASSVESVVVVISNPDSGDSETITILETDFDTGIFHGCLDSTQENAVLDDNRITFKKDSRLIASYTDPLDGGQVLIDNVLVDPLGVVFNSITGELIEGAVIHIREKNSGMTITLPQPPDVPNEQNNPYETLEDGFFQFEFVPAGEYYFHVELDDEFSFPSVVPNEYLPPGFVVETGSRGETFVLVEGMQPLNLDIPVDPEIVEILSVTKTASKSVANIGDVVQYTVTVKNAGNINLSDVSIFDTMPHGVIPADGTCSLDGAPLNDAVSIGSRTFKWEYLRDLPAGESFTLTYGAVIGPDSNRGDGINRVYATGISLGNQLVSREAEFRLKISEGVFTTRGTILGKVFDDDNANGRQDNNEPGIENVLLYMEDGTWVRTDSDGKFSINAVREGTHVLRIDEPSIEGASHIIGTSSRFAGNSPSQFVEVPQGGLAVVDFAVYREFLNEKKMLSYAGDQPEMNGLFAAGDPDPRENEMSRTAQEESPENIPIEKQILNIANNLDFLSPADGSVLNESHVAVTLKAPLSRKLELFVNGVEADKKHIGKQVSNNSKNITVYEFVSIELEKGRSNNLTAITKTGEGLIDKAVEISVYVTGPPASIDIESENMEIPADGSSASEFTVRLLDTNDYNLLKSDPVTVSINRGDILEADADNNTYGKQISYKNGCAIFTVRAPMEVGEAELKIWSGDIEKSVKVFFAPHMRDAFSVGFAEISMGNGSIEGNPAVIRDNTDMNDDSFISGRASFFMKKKLGKSALLTTAMNSDNSSDTELFREPENIYESEANYPVYGDESRKGYEASSRNQFFMRVDRGKSFMVYGDNTVNFNSTKLGAYYRALNGFYSEVNNDDYNLKTFVSSTGQSKVVDSLPARGVSGFYELSRNAIIEGSEQVVIEVRDRLQIDRVLDRQARARWTDYNIDYDSGTIIFKAPVPSRDSELNPVFIVVSYEIDTGRGDYLLYGIRSMLRLATGLALGFTGVKEEQETGGDRLLGLDFDWDIPDVARITAEWASTESLFDESSVSGNRDSDGWSVDLESNVSDSLTINGFFRRTGFYFGNDSAFDIMRGKRIYGTSFNYSGNHNINWYGEHSDEYDMINEADRRFSLLGLRRANRKTNYSIEYFRSVSRDSYIPQEESNSRYPFDNSDETPDEVRALRLNSSTQLSTSLSLDMHAQQDLDGRYNNASIGLNKKVNNLTSIYVRDEINKYDERTENRLVGGIESTVAGNIVGFNEYRLEQGAEGSRINQLIGLRNNYKINNNVSGNLSVEKLDTIRGEDRDGESDASAASLSLNYLNDDSENISTKYEFRKGSSSKSHLFNIGLSAGISPEHRLILAGRHYDYKSESISSRIESRISFGLSYRPLKNNRYNAFAKIIVDRDKNTNETVSYSERNRIISIEQAYQTSGKAQITAKYAVKWSDNHILTSKTDFISTMLLYDITNRWDIGVSFRNMKNSTTNSSTNGKSMELRYLLKKNLQLGMGYNFDRFTSDLTDDSYTGKGCYIKLRLKLEDRHIR